MKITATFRAEAYLIKALRDGPMPIADVMLYARRNGIGESTLRVAARALTLRQKAGGSLWELDPELFELWRDDFAEFVAIGSDALSSDALAEGKA